MILVTYMRSCHMEWLLDWSNTFKMSQNSAFELDFKSNSFGCSLFVNSHGYIVIRRKHKTNQYFQSILSFFWACSVGSYYSHMYFYCLASSVHVCMTWNFWNEYLLRHLILDLIPHPKLPYFAIATCPLAQGMASVHASLLASDRS